jgi:hypothetical protein
MTTTQARRIVELRETAAKLLRLASELEADFLQLEPADASNHKFRGTQSRKVWTYLDREMILAKVLDAYKARRRRKSFFPADVFGEPGWDLLLDLFAARLQNRRISVSSACIAADVPLTTALRWLGLLEQFGLVERTDSDSDQRVTWVRLTDSATASMSELYEFKQDLSLTDFADLSAYLIQNPGGSS